MQYRIEHDSMGEIKVPADRYWGAQTQRSFENFKIGIEKIPADVIQAFSYLKEAAAVANFNLDRMDQKSKDLISQVCQEIRDHKLDENFPLAVWQTGSG
ncbi:MAG: class II fumarate hydratase, partial [Eubacterium sp.]|nr:class II fumarate hydratase [Eubacterium sp.]